MFDSGIKYFVFILFISSLNAISMRTPASAAAIDLGEILITAPADSPDSRIKLDPASTTVIHRESFASSSATMAEILEETAGVEIKSYGGLGGFSTVSIRGSESDHVLILVDGVPLNRAAGGAVDIGSLPLSNVEKIEVYRSNAPVKYSETAIGGLINIITRKPEGRAAIEANAGAGSFGSRSAGFFARSPFGNMDLSLSAAIESSGGDFEYLDDNGTQFNDSDDEWVKRTNNDFFSSDIGIGMNSSLSKDRLLKLSLQDYRKDQGIPGLGNLQSNVADLKTIRNLVKFDFEDPGVMIGNVFSTLSISRLYYRTDFSDPLSEIGLGAQNNRNITDSFSLGGAFEWNPSERREATLTLRYGRERQDPLDAMQTIYSGAPSVRKTIAAAFEERIKPGNGKLLLIPSARIERVSSRLAGDNPFLANAAAAVTSRTDTATTAYFGARYSVSKYAMIKANAGRYYRAPSFYELFGDRGSTIGNPGLESEKGVNFDIGVSTDFSGRGQFSGSFETGFFHNRTNNLIVFIQNSQRTAKPMNIGRADIRGFETSLTLHFSGRFKLTGNHTYQNARDDGDIAFRRGNSLPGRHEREINLRPEYSAGPWRAWYLFSLSSGNFLDPANLYPVPERRVHTAGVSFTMKSSTVTLEGKNLTDSRISDVLGFPLPGRSYFLTLKKVL